MGLCTHINIDLRRSEGILVWNLEEEEVSGYGRHGSIVLITVSIGFLLKNDIE